MPRPSAPSTGRCVGREQGSGLPEEPGVGHNSTTETYAALKLYIDNWRWRNVPFYLRTGKRLARTNSLIAIRFKHPPQQLFRYTAIEQLKPNWLLLNIQPNECMRMEIQVKQPGLEMRTQTERLDASPAPPLRADRRLRGADPGRDRGRPHPFSCASTRSIGPGGWWIRC
jgi:glucose-6-phosphate 1-dehydrogenase